MRKILKKTKKEIRTIISDLDLFSRILIGQYDEMIYVITKHFFSSYDDEGLNKSLENLRAKMIPYLTGRNMNSSLGIWSVQTPLVAMRAYDIQQCLRYVFSYHENPEGGWTRNFDTPYLHGEWDVDKKHLNEYHKILAENNCPDYRPDYLIRNLWACPVILNHFNDEEDSVELIIDDINVEEIIEQAKRWKEFVVSEKFFELFWEVKDYHGITITKEELKTYTDVILETLKNYKETLY